MKNESNYKTDASKYEELAIRSYYNTSFSPERRGKSDCKEFEEMATALKDAGASDSKLEKFESLFVAKLNAQSKCASTMITGASNFPVKRAEKANKSFENRLNEYFDFYNNTIEKIKKAKLYEEHPELRPISSSDNDAIERLKQKLEALKDAQAKMVQANKLIRSGDKDGLVKLVGEKTASELLVPNRSGVVGFERFQLGNNNAKIKEVEKRISQIESAKEAGDKEEVIADGVKLFKDASSMRVYFEFDGKPSADIISLLKSNGFKWTPSKGHWGRKLTNNALYSTKRVVSAIRELKNIENQKE